MRPHALLVLLALLAAAVSAHNSVFASADAAHGDDVVIVTSNGHSARSSQPRQAPALSDGKPRRRAAIQFLGKPSEHEDDDDDDDQPTALIVGGKRVPAKLRKHMARVIGVLSSGSLVACTGSVMSRTYVLSAAHCFVDSDVGDIDIKASYVLIAERTTKTKFFASPRNKIFMKNVFVHRKYRPDGTFANDLALVELQEEIDDRFYSAIELQKPPSESGTKLQAAGYGVRGSAQQKSPKRVRRADVLFQRWSVCDDELGFSGANDRGREMCYTSVGFPDQGRTGTCFGDSGGPIVRRVDGQFVQVGITSYFYGDECESAGAVMVAMNVHRYRKLIRRKVRRNRNRGWRRLR